MLRYILRRLLLLIPLLLAASAIIFLLLRLGAGDRRWIIYACRTCRPRKRWLPRP